MKVTKQNLPFICFLLNKLIKDYFKVQYYYNTSKKLNKVLEYYNIYSTSIFDMRFRIEVSNPIYYSNITIILSSCKTFIIMFSEYKEDQAGHIIDIGDSITFNKDLIIHKTEHPTEKSKCICKITNFK